jgi:hypothetical protein
MRQSGLIGATDLSLGGSSVNIILLDLILDSTDSDLLLSPIHDIPSSLGLSLLRGTNSGLRVAVPRTNPTMELKVGGVWAVGSKSY